jgi:hypothetical protein
LAKRKSRLDGAAVTFGAALGSALNQVEAQVSSANAQRQAAIKSLMAVRDRANRMLADLGHAVMEVPLPRIGKRRGRPPKQVGSALPSAAKASAPGRKRGVMSAEGRARIAEAQRKRWAKIKAAKKSGK